MRLFNFKSNRVNDKNTNGKKKKSKVNKLIPPVAMISASMLLMAYSSYAWFSMNTKTIADGMHVKVKAEGGLAIALANDRSATTWKWQDSVTVDNAVIDLYPTSTKDTNTWYHNLSSNPALNKTASDTNYTTLESIKDSSYDSSSPGIIGYVDTYDLGKFNKDIDQSYYLLNKFKIKSNRAPINTDLLINEVKVTPASSNNIDKSLRVAIVVTSKQEGGTSQTDTYIYAPLRNDNATYTYNVAGSAGTVSLNDLNSTQHTSASKIGFEDTDAIDVSIYCYFEGEDDNCYSDNLKSITLNELNVSVKFGVDANSIK